MSLDLGVSLIAFFRLAVLRKNIAFTVLLSSLSIALLLLAIAEFSGKAMCVSACFVDFSRHLDAFFFPGIRVTKAGGVFGIITGLIAYYIGVSELLAGEERAIMRVPLGVWP